MEKPSLLLQRLAQTSDLLISVNRHWHANVVTAAIERISNQELRLRRLEVRLADLKKALDVECAARDRAEVKRERQGDVPGDVNW